MLLPRAFVVQSAAAVAAREPYASQPTRADRVQTFCMTINNYEQRLILKRITEARKLYLAFIEIIIR